jgi:hypothetical protein
MATRLAPQAFSQTKQAYDTTRGLIKLWEIYKSPSFKFVESHPRELKSGIEVMFEPLLKPPSSDMLNHEGPEGSDISDIGSLTGQGSSSGSSDSGDNSPGSSDDTQVEVSIWVHHHVVSGGPAPGTAIVVIDGSGNEIPVELDSNGKATVYGAPGTWSITVSAPHYEKEHWSGEVYSGSEVYADIFQEFIPPIWIEIGPLV